MTLENTDQTNQQDSSNVVVVGQQQLQHQTTTTTLLDLNDNSQQTTHTNIAAYHRYHHHHHTPLSPHQASEFDDDTESLVDHQRHTTINDENIDISSSSPLSHVNNNHHHSRITTTTTKSPPSLDSLISSVQLDKLNNLIDCIKQGDYQEFLKLLKSCQTFRKLLNVFVNGQTALHYSLIHGRDITWCKQLVLNGADPNLTNRAGWHPIHLAAYNSTNETLNYLIERIR